MGTIERHSLSPVMWLRAHPMLYPGEWSPNLVVVEGEVEYLLENRGHSYVNLDADTVAADLLTHNIRPMVVCLCGFGYLEMGGHVFEASGLPGNWTNMDSYES